MAQLSSFIYSTPKLNEQIRHVSNSKVSSAQLQRLRPHRLGTILCVRSWTCMPWASAGWNGSLSHTTLAGSLLRCLSSPGSQCTLSCGPLIGGLFKGLLPLEIDQFMKKNIKTVILRSNTGSSNFINQQIAVCVHLALSRLCPALTLCVTKNGSSSQVPCLRLHMGGSCPSVSNANEVTQVKCFPMILAVNTNRVYKHIITICIIIC